MRVACVDDPRWTDKEHGDGSDNCKSIRAKLAKPDPYGGPPGPPYTLYFAHFDQMARLTPPSAIMGLKFYTDQWEPYAHQERNCQSVGKPFRRIQVPVRYT
jgi:hypothetical protein